MQCVSLKTEHLCGSLLFVQPSKCVGRKYHHNFLEVALINHHNFLEVALINHHNFLEVALINHHNFLEAALISHHNFLEVALINHHNCLTQTNVLLDSISKFRMIFFRKILADHMLTRCLFCSLFPNGSSN
eukprot:TRINITY_DN7096_c0_g1_i2.p1 TRINITY_DN7096_c0_g1~~TRINITY_DN7096_c0_g1_i2.p1  ORF type:complete len:131 (+),score=38.33 TRINITY_DN7096_c0_g1_i2:87-479(+)